MERLTYDFCIGGNHCWQVKGADNNLCKDICINQGESGCGGCPIKKAFDRLAAYENTGLEPKQSMLISNVLREVGETYNCWFDYVANCTVKNSHLKELAQAEKAGQLVVLPCKIGDTVFLLNPERTCIVRIRVQGLSISPTGRIVLHFGGCPPEYAWGDGCGKEWFLTREEAEAALKNIKEKPHEQNKN